MAPNWFANYWWSASWFAPLGAPGSKQKRRFYTLGLGLGLGLTRVKED